MEYCRTPHSNRIHSALPSCMVAEGVGITSPTSQHHTPSVKRNSSTVTDQPVLPRWRLRDGRNDDFIKWHDALVSLEADLDFELEEEQPSYHQLVTRYSDRYPDYVKNEHVIDMTVKAATAWLDDSNLLFDVIKASLILDGAHLERDLRKISSFVSPGFKDARSLRSWALSFADLSSLDNQVDLRKKLDVKLDAGSNYKLLEKHCRDYWSAWSHVAGNTTSQDSLMTFYMQLLSTLPSQPEGAHLTSVRKWLADKITESSPMLMDVDDSLDKLLKYASVIGLSLRSAAPSDAHVPAVQATSWPALLKTCRPSPLVPSFC